MADRFLKSLAARLRFVAANPPLLPLLALLLLGLAGSVQFFLLPARQAAFDAAEIRLAGLERSARRAAIERQSHSGSPDETRQRLLERFPDETQLNGELGRLLEMAASGGLSLASGDYRLQPARDGMFDRYVLNLPVKGEYRKIRHYVQAVRQAFPDLAVDDIGLRRENIGSLEVEAQLRLVLFSRRPAP